jgi:hypothetical protein
VSDECLRCGYDLRGIDNTQPCPECGLLAERSRRVSDELHDTRPRWLRSLAIGVTLIPLATVLLVAWPFVFASMSVWYYTRFARLGLPVTAWIIFPWLGVDLALLLFVVAVWLLAVREGYPPADREDARLRLALRVACLAPLAALVLAHVQNWFQVQSVYRRIAGPPAWLDYAVMIATTVACAPLPLLLFYRLRGLARRVHSAHLAEHCMIVGIGASLSFLYFAFAWVMLEHGDEWFGPHWTTRSQGWLIITGILATLGFLFALWSLYLLIRFAIAFWWAYRVLRQKWKVGDRAAAAGATASPIPAGSR